MRILDTLKPYEEIEHVGIQYTTCRDYGHISRYKGLRQLVHDPSSIHRYITLETPNSFESHSDITFYDVPASEEDRLDIIAYKFLGSASYGWVIAYFNQIEDGFSVKEGQRLKIPKTISQLFNQGEILAPINALQLNLYTE